MEDIKIQTMENLKNKENETLKKNYKNIINTDYLKVLKDYFKKSNHGFWVKEKSIGIWNNKRFILQDKKFPDEIVKSLYDIPYLEKSEYTVELFLNHTKVEKYEEERYKPYYGRSGQKLFRNEYRFFVKHNNDEEYVLYKFIDPVVFEENEKISEETIYNILINILERISDL